MAVKTTALLRIEPSLRSGVNEIMSLRPSFKTLFCLTASLLLMSSPAWSLRCGNAIIVKGDPQAKVLRYCGEPATRASRYEFRPGVYRDTNPNAAVNGDGTARRGQYLPFGNSDVLVEDWTYNFGPNKLMRRVRFANGFVEDVQELGYGYR